MNAVDLSDFTHFAQELADDARAILRERFRAGLAFERKADDSPVTAADVEVEKHLRERIVERFPEHGILGEELGGERLDAEWVWVLDPIDGTRSFATGRPTFVNLVSLTRAGRPVVGVIEAPATEERWVGVDGRETTYQGEPVRVRPAPALSDAVLYVGMPRTFSAEHAAGYDRLREAAGWVFYEGDGYAHGLVASGRVDLVVERMLGPDDSCALVPVVAGAGGAISHWDGSPVGIETDGTIVSAGSRELALQAIAVLQG